MTRLPTPTLRGLGVVLMALGLVTSMAGAGVLGPQADRTADDLSPVGEAEALACGGACVVGAGVVVGMAAGYAASEYLEPEGDAYTRVDANETHQEVYGQSVMVSGQLNQTSTIMQNTVEGGSRNLAWNEAKRAGIVALNAGKNRSVAGQWATENVSDYYAVTEENTLNQWTSSMNEMKYLAGVYGSHDSLSNPYLSPRYSAAGYTFNSKNFGESAFSTKNYTLVNGSAVEYTYARINGHSWVDGTKSGDAYIGFQSVSGIDTRNPLVMKAGYGSNQTKVIRTSEYLTVLNAIDTANQQMTDNADVWVNETYDSYSAGEINLTDIPDASTLSQEFNTDENTTGYYAYAGADLAMMGVGSNLNETFTVEQLDNGSVTETLHGTLFSNWEPSQTNGSWVNGTVYDTANTSDLVYVATNDGLQLVEGEFRISEMRNAKTGEKVNKTVHHHYNRQTSNVSVTEEQLQELIEVREDINDAEAAAAGGGGGGDLFPDLGFGGGGSLGLIIAALGGAALLAGRN